MRTLNFARRSGALVGLLGTAVVVAAGPAPAFQRMARVGEAFPGRTGYVYDTAGGTPFVGARSNDPAGDIYFHARGVDGSGAHVEDLLVYRHATQTVEPYARTGETIDGAPATMIWGAVGGGAPGLIGHLATLDDGTSGGARAVIVSRPGGSRTVAARQGQAVPGQAGATFTTVGFASGSFNDVNINPSGAVSYGGRFRDAGNTLRYGYYLTQPGGAAERIIDSTMAVPGRPNATWVNYDGIGAPFDIYTPGIDGAGNAFFRGKFREDGTDYRAFYRRGVDGAISAIVTSAADEVAGLPGYTYNRFRTAANNQNGDVAFGADVRDGGGAIAGYGVFAKRADGPLQKVLTYADSVPGIPEAHDHTPALLAMNDANHLLVTVDYRVNDLPGQSLVLFNPDGTGKPVLRFDDVPGLPGDRAGQAIAADLNSAGDVAFITRMNTTPTKFAALAYLNDSDMLVPILKTGDELDGLTVVSFGLGGGANDPMGSIAAAGGPVAWDDQHLLSLSVVLEDDNGVRSYALYAVRVPEPTTAALLLVLVLARCASGMR